MRAFAPVEGRCRSAARVFPHLDGPFALQAAARTEAGGIIESRSAIWTRIGQRSLSIRVIARFGPLGEDGAARDLVSPGRPCDRAHAGLGVIGGHSGQLAGGPTVGEHQRLPAASHPDSVLKTDPGEAEWLPEAGVAADLVRVARPSTSGDLLITAAIRGSAAAA